MPKHKKPIYVTQPELPDLGEFNEYLRKIWQNRIITNNGPLHQEFEEKLATFLGVEHISVFSNGTLALITALQALSITGEVITTPYSFVATTHSLWWNKLMPVFVDIEPDYFTLDPGKIEEAITPQTTAIMPVHVYGNPCRTEEIERIAHKHQLKVIYDAAHAFGVEKKGKSILQNGDLSILSFHATKVFNTIEGGAIVSKSAEMKKRIDHLKNFGFEDEVTVVGPGINAKMNELQAAFGLLQLKSITNSIEKRRLITQSYRSGLKNTPGITFLDDIPGVKHNYAYFPILVDEASYGKSRDGLYEELKNNNIYARRYFYPLISQFPPYNELGSAKKENLMVANNIAEKILCLPIYPSLDLTKAMQIAELIKKDAKQ